MSQEVKRIRVFHLSELLCPRGLLVADESPMPDHNSELLPVTEHDRAVAKLKAEVDHLNRQLADAMSGCCDCPMFKAQGKTVKRQPRPSVFVIDERVTQKGHFITWPEIWKNPANAFEHILKQGFTSQDIETSNLMTDIINRLAAEKSLQNAITR